MKKVLIVADSGLGTSGVPAVIMSIIRTLHLEYSFDIVVFDDTNTPFAKEFVSYGGKIILFNIYKPTRLHQKLSFYLFGYRKQVFKECNSKLDIMDYSIIHSFKGLFSAPFFEYAKKNKVSKRILHINGIYHKNHNIFLNCLNLIYKHYCIKYSNIRLAVSKEAGYSFFGKQIFKCVYNPINDELYKKLPIYYDQLSLTQIGTFSDRKNQLFSLEVLREVKKKHPNATIHFLGYEVEAGYLGKIRDLGKEYNLEQSIYYYPSSYNQIELLKKTSICLFPSKSEAFGLVAVENQACNKAVICSNNIIKEVDCGGAFFLELDAKKWANVIDCIYVEKKQFNINTDKFSSKNYSFVIESVYN